MSRIVKRTQTGPYRLAIGGEEKYLCQCGLSKDQPFCDGSHRRTAAEQPGKLYWYDENGARHETDVDLPGILTF